MKIIRLLLRAFLPRRKLNKKMAYTVIFWERRCKVALASSGKKQKVKVLFLPANIAMWKYDFLFQKMQEHPRFEPVILPAPAISLTDQEQVIERDRMKQYFAEKGFPVVDSEMDVKSIKPDFVFITQGYGKFAQYWQGDFPKALGCYSPYSYPTSFSKGLLDLIELNRVWRIFDTTREHAEDLKKLMSNSGRNVRVVGYTNADYFLQKNKSFSFKWKCNNSKLKKIVYAPHWTIAQTSTLQYATFLEMGETMLSLAQKYADKTQWCFKPHPWLFRALRRHPDWGEKRAKEYFKRWEELENATYSSESYIDLFMTSDAMIHDCGSFRCEYFYTKNPAMYLVKEGQLENDGDIGKIAFNAHYHGRSREDIERFIEDVVLGGNDPKKEERERFYEKYLLPPNNQSVAQNIMDEIERGLGWK